MPEKTLAQKMGLKPGMTLLVVGAPDGYPEMLGELPEDVTVSESTAVAPSALHVFARTLADVDEQLRELRGLIGEDTLVWLSYPKGRPKEEINRDSIWASLLGTGLRPVAQVSVDEEWSALRLRLEA